MKTRIEYRDIPKAERKSLAVEAIRQSKALRMIQYASIMIPIMLGGAVAKEFVLPHHFFERLGITVGAALLVSLLIWESLGRPKLRAEIERLKNS